VQTQEKLRQQSDDPFVEIDPFGCPYCGGPIGEGPPQCSHCGRSVELRLRRKPGGAALSWLITLFLALSLAVGLQGLFLTEMVGAGQVPQWLDRSLFKVAIGRAFFSPDGIGDELAETADLLTRIHYGLAGLGAVAALGLALRSRLVYFVAFFLLILMAAAPVAGLLTQLVGWAPAIVLIGLIAFAAAWLADMAPAFEWETRSYRAELDPGLKTHADYYRRGKQCAEIEMWAKAAAHWRVATQLGPGQALYHAALAKAFAELEYPGAARAAADRALALEPEDMALGAFLESLAGSEETT
jgi:tetratricopeptide (TPR) repeat protein/predicted nucleic acid-binding Zn ribbon protein